MNYLSFQKTIPALALIAVVCFPQPGFATSQIWNGDSVANGNWSTGDNWVGNVAPGSTSSTTNGDTATFNAAIANTWGDTALNPIVIDSATQNLGSLLFTGTSGSYFIGSTGGNKLMITSGGSINIDSSLSATNALITINAPVEIQEVTGNNVTIFQNNSANGTGAGAGTLTLNGNISEATAQAKTLRLRGTNTNLNTINGDISGTTLSVFKDSGAGVWSLTGNNTYSGQTRVNVGILRIDSATALSANSNLIFEDASFGVLGLGAGNFSRSQGTSGGQVRFLTNASGGFAAYGADRTASMSGPLTWGGGSFMVGTGTFVLSADSATHKLTFTDTINLGASGTNTRTVQVNNGSGAIDGELSGVLSGTAGQTLSKTGAGTLLLSNDNTYAGPTTVSAGTLLINGNHTGTGTVTVASGATLGGQGTLAGATTVDGSIAPGVSGIAQLNIAADITWNGSVANKWVFDLGAANSADLLNITGSFLKGTGTGGSDFVFDFGTTGSLGTYKLVDWTTSTGFVASDFDYTNLSAGLTGSFAINGSQLDFTVVPEPGTASMLFLSGLAALLLRRRRLAACNKGVLSHCK